MQIRLGLERDRPAVIALGRAMMAEMEPRLAFDAPTANATYSRYLATADPTVFVADDRGEVVGFLLACWHGYAACAGFFIAQELFYVRPDKRGSRAAAGLFTAFVQWAKSLNPEEITAAIHWGRRSEAGARWLRRFGFEPAAQYNMRLRVG